MFRFLEIELHGWDLWPPFMVPLNAGVAILSGPNGSGKTTFLDAIRQILHAPHLSQKRRLTKYLRRANRPALLRAVVTNRADDRGRRPFDRQQIFTDEATLACALVPDGATPEKRFTVLPGRVAAPDLQTRLLEGRDWLRPEEYKRLLEYAGVSRSLLHILALEQGRADSLAEQKPTDLFRWVMTARGSQQVLERYQTARLRYADSVTEVTRQSEAVIRHQATLGELGRKIQRLSDYQDKQNRVEVANDLVAASHYQQLLNDARGTESKLPELRTKVTNLTTSIDRLGRELAAETAALETLTAEAERVQSLAAELVDECDSLASAHGETSAEVTRLQSENARLKSIPPEETGELERQAARLRLEIAGAEMRRVEREPRAEELRAREADLSRGVPRFPRAVEVTLATLKRASIDATLLTERLEIVEDSWANAIESALGDARYAVHVDPHDEAAAAQIALQCEFPGPIVSELSDRAFRNGLLTVAPGAPRWFSEWAATFSLASEAHPDRQWSLTREGVRRDDRGVWVSQAGNRVMGAAGIRAELARVQQELAELERADSADAATSTQLLAQSREIEQRLALQQERQRLVAAVAVLPEQEKQLSDLADHLSRRRGDRNRVLTNSREIAQGVTSAGAELSTKQGQLLDRRKELDGTREACTEGEAKLLALEPEIKASRSGVKDELRRMAEEDSLPQLLLAERDAASARNDLLRFEAEGPLPDESVVREHEVLQRNIEEFERHIAERQSEADRAHAELGRCRGDYLEVVRSTLHDYARRARALAEVASARIEVDLPTLENDDRCLDEAGIQVRIGFDGKPPTDLADPAHSGGQRVIAGLILLMAMAETEGDSFFIVDEPFAHLSMDRVDDVGRFLRTSGAQFLITVPTTLDRGQLDPASLLIVLHKKRAEEEFAKRPMVLRP